MLGRSALTNTNDSSSRIFIYEIEGLSQKNQTPVVDTAIRSSGKMLVPVPFSRMSSFMQKMNSMGVKVSSIYPSGQAPQTTTED